VHTARPVHGRAPVCAAGAERGLRPAVDTAGCVPQSIRPVVDPQCGSPVHTVMRLCTRCAPCTAGLRCARPVPSAGCVPPSIHSAARRAHR